VTKGVLHISESVHAFVTRLKITKNFAQLTRPNGSPVWINGPAVSPIRVPLPNEYIAGVNTVVFAGSLSQGVTECLVAATSAIGGALAVWA